MPEITEEELRALRNTHQVVTAMLKHPKAGVLLEQAHKEVDPSVKTPRMDAQRHQDELLKPALDQVASLKAQIDADKAAREKELSDRQLAQISANHEAAFNRLRGRGWMDDGIKGVRELMEKHGILDVEIAASHWEKLHPPAAPNTSRGQGAWNLFAGQDAAGDAEDIKKLLETKGESELLVDQMAHKALTEIRAA